MVNLEYIETVNNFIINNNILKITNDSTKEFTKTPNETINNSMILLHENTR